MHFWHTLFMSVCLVCVCGRRLALLTCVLLAASLLVLPPLPPRCCNRQRRHLTNTDSLLVAAGSAASASDWPVAADNDPPPGGVGPPRARGAADLCPGLAGEFGPASCAVLTSASGAVNGVAFTAAGASISTGGANPLASR